MSLYYENIIDTLRDSLYELNNDHQSQIEDLENQVASLSERAERAESALREVLDRLDDWHRELCDRDEVVTGPMIRELVYERFTTESHDQRLRSWNREEQ